MKHPVSIQNLLHQHKFNPLLYLTDISLSLSLSAFVCVCVRARLCVRVCVCARARRKKKILVKWCIEPIQPLWIKSGLKTNFNPSLSYSTHKSRNVNHNIYTAQSKYFAKRRRRKEEDEEEEETQKERTSAITAAKTAT